MAQLSTDDLRQLIGSIAEDPDAKYAVSTDDPPHIRPLEGQGNAAGIVDGELEFRIGEFWASKWADYEVVTESFVLDGMHAWLDGLQGLYRDAAQRRMNAEQKRGRTKQASERPAKVMRQVASLPPLPDAEIWRQVIRPLTDDADDVFAEVFLAAADPESYFALFQHDLNERAITDPTQVRPWIALVDALRSRGALVELDWKAGCDETYAAVAKVLKARTGGTVAMQSTSGQQYALPGSIRDSVRRIEGRGWAGAVLDIASDCYPLALVRLEEAAALGRAGRKLNKGNARQRIDLIRP